MNKKLIPFFEFGKRRLQEGAKIDEVLDELKDEGATIAISIKVMEKLGCPHEQIEGMLNNSLKWKGYFRSFEDLFFDFVELDDDLVE
ncbi:MAG: hypothetical protein ACOYXT_22050 [Bacteroidota bacterium]